MSGWRWSPIRWSRHGSGMFGSYAAVATLSLTVPFAWTIPGVAVFGLLTVSAVLAKDQFVGLDAETEDVDHIAT